MRRRRGHRSRGARRDAGNGDPHSVHYLLEVFVVEFATLLEPATAAIAGRDRVTLAGAAHAARSAAGSAAARRLAGMLG